MKTRTLLLLAAAMLAGCATTTTVTGVPMDVVIDKLKEQLNTVGPISVNYLADTDGCTPKGNYSIIAFPTKTQVQLKTAFTDTNTAGIGGQFGTPVVVAPTAQRIASSVKTTQTTLNFCAIPESLKGAENTAPNADCLWTLKNPKGDYVKSLWPTKLKTVTLDPADINKHQKLVTVSSSTQPVISDLAQALGATVGGLVYSQHKNACLLPQTMDVQLAFEAIVDISGGFKFSLVFINIQDTQDYKRDFTNTLDVTFNLSKGSTPTLLQSLF
jgi:hypothetical protein